LKIIHHHPNRFINITYRLWFVKEKYFFTNLGLIFQTLIKILLLAYNRCIARFFMAEKILNSVVTQTGREKCRA